MACMYARHEVILDYSQPIDFSPLSLVNAPTCFLIPSGARAILQFQVN